MPRTAWSRLTLALIALGALALVSCFHDVGDCPTCPGVNSSTIEVDVPLAGLLDSVHVSVDGGAQVSVRRNRRQTFANLSRGTHEVTLVRWFSIDGNVTSRSSSLRIELERGETRVIIFHNDFPLIAWAPVADPDRADGPRARAPIAPGMG
jgi:hypothetical protein